tara:strand:- start:7485 stop:8393 length:909 start_codon:yes stop_codon:yes gene_type:complete
VNLNINWKNFLKDFYRELVNDNVTSGAASLAFFLLLSLFPALIALISIGAYLPIGDVQEMILSSISPFLPYEAFELIKNILNSVLSEKNGGLLTFGVLAALWTASTGMVQITKQLNIAYHIKEDRNFFKLRLMAIGISLVLGAVLIISLMLVLGERWVKAFAIEQGMHSTLVSILFPLTRGLTIFSLVSFLFALIYYFPPNKKIKFKWITPGSVLGTVLVFAISKGFSFYVENFGNYANTYGSIGAVIILMLWLYLFSLILIIGAELNSLLASYIEPHSNVSKKKKLQKNRSLKNNEWIYQH